MNQRMPGGLDDEIRDFIERETEENIERGMTPGEARQAAMRKFGNIARVKEETHDVWRLVWLDQLRQDVRSGLRILRRNPGFAAVVVLTLGIGVAMSAVAFSVVDTVLLRPLSYPRAQQLVMVGQYDPRIRRDTAFLPDFPVWRSLAHSYDALAGYSFDQKAISAPTGVLQLTGVAVLGDFWKITGAAPAKGRLFGATEPNTIVLTWGVFEREFASDERWIGKHVAVDGRQFTLAGVLRKDFRFQFPVWWLHSDAQAAEYFVPLGQEQLGMGRTGLVIGRLKAGLSETRAQVEIQAIEKRIIEEHLSPMEVPRTWDDLRVASIAEKMRSPLRPALLVLLGAGVCVLLIGSVNVANLLLARATAHQAEFALRAALGAGRMRLVRQFLTESAVLAVAGCAAGLLMTEGALHVLAKTMANSIPRANEVTANATVVWFALAVSLGTCLIFGMAPARVLWRRDLNRVIKRLQMPRFLVAAELALAIVLLSGAGLLLKSFRQMLEYPAGFSPERVLVMKARLMGPAYQARQAQEAYVRALARKLSSLAGVEAAGLSNRLMWSGETAFPSDRGARVTHVVHLNASSPDYPKAMGMRLLKGRWLNAGDVSGVAVINASMAREAFGSENPIGRTLTVPQPMTVVGVAEDLKYSKLDEAVPPEAFIPFGKFPVFFGADVAVRVRGDAASMAQAVRAAVASIDPTQPVYDLKTLDDALGDSIAPRRFQLLLLGTFAGCALVLSLVGIYGLLAYSVAQRTREIGVRVALGARRIEVVGMVVREGMAIAGGGMAVGLIAALGLTRVMTGLLYEVRADDPATFGIVVAGLAVTALVACFGPAVQAARLDPMVALRSE